MAPGAIGRSIVGNRIQHDNQGTRSERRGETVNNQLIQCKGYVVEYNYAGRGFSAVTANDPGATARVNLTINPQ